MFIKSEIESIKNERRILSAKIEDFETDCRATLTRDHRRISASLAATGGFLEGGVDFLSLRKRHLKFPTAQENSVGHGAKVIKDLRALSEAAQSGLKTIKDINARYHDLDAELQSLRTRSVGVCKKARSELESVKSSLTQAKKDAETASKRHEECKKNLESLERVIQEKKDDRNAMRVVRGFVWVTSVVVHPLIPVAAALEMKAASMGAKREELQQKKVVASAESARASAQVSQLQAGIKLIQTALEDANKNHKDAERDANALKPLQKEVGLRLRAYQELKEAVDDLAHSTKLARQQSEDMLLLNVDSKRLAATARPPSNLLLDRPLNGSKSQPSTGIDFSGAATALYFGLAWVLRAAILLVLVLAFWFLLFYVLDRLSLGSTVYLAVCFLVSLPLGPVLLHLWNYNIP